MLYKIIKGTSAVFLNSFFTILLGLLLVPIILSSVGQEKYGLIVLIIFLSVRSGILGIFTFGIQQATTKFVAEYYANKEYSKITTLLASSIIFYSFISTILICILFFAKEWLFLDVFNVSSQLLNDYLKAFNFFLASILFQFISLVFLGYFEGLHQFFISKTIDTLSYTAYFLATLLSLNLGYGYIEIIKLFSFMHIFTFLLCLLAFKLNKAHFNIKVAFERELSLVWLKYCAKLFSNSIAATLWNHSPKFFVTTLLSPSYLAIYDIVSKIPGNLKSFFGLGNRVIVPTASELLAKGKGGSNKQLFNIGLKLNLLLFTPFLIVLTFFADTILSIWVGEEFIQYAYLMQILLLIPLLSMFMSFGFSIFLGTNHRIGLFAFFGWMILFISVTYMYFQVEVDGMDGVVIGRVLGLALTVPAAMIIFFRAFEVNTFNFLLRVWLLIALTIISFYTLKTNFLMLNGIAITNFLLLSSVLYLLYFILIYLILFNSKERDFLLKIIKVLMLKLRTNP